VVFKIYSVVDLKFQTNRKSNVILLNVVLCKDEVTLQWEDQQKMLKRVKPVLSLLLSANLSFSFFKTCCGEIAKKWEF